MIKKLYEQGFSDVKISKKLGISSKRVAEWRNVNNLPTQQERERKMKANNDKDEKVDNRKTYAPTSYIKPLTPRQRKVASVFIKHLILAHKLNPSLDVSQFIKGYRDYLARKEKKEVLFL